MGVWNLGRASSLAVVAAGSLAAVLSSCAPKTVGPRLRTAPGPDPCVLVPGPIEADSRILVGLVDPVDPDRAPVSGNDAEALVFTQLYDTLVRVDCEGRTPISGLAAAWTRDESDREWRFTLDRSREFHDGRHLTASSVIESWRRTAAQSNAEPWNGPWAWIDPDSLFAIGASELRVVLRRPASAALFAHPHLAVVGRRPPGTGWRLGTGAWRVAVAGAQQLVCVSVETTGRTRRKERELVFRLAPGADPRDLLDRGVDLLLTRSPEVRAYGESLEDYRIVDLPADREYLLASPVPVPDAMRVSDAEDELRAELVSLMSGMAADRAAFSADDCPDGFPPSPDPVTISPVAPRDGRVIRFFSHDPDAGRLAGRLIAIAGSRDGVFGMTGTYASEPAAPGERIHRGPAGATERFLIPIRRLFPDPCRQREALFGAIGMPVLGDVDPFTHRNTLDRRVLPLLRTAPILIHRASVGGLRRDWNGVLLLDGCGRLKGAAP